MTEFEKCISKIKAWRAGGVYTIRFYNMPDEKTRNIIHSILHEAYKMGLIEPISTDLSLDLEITEERWKRTSNDCPWEE